ncbi:unnamed protein product [Camellia sinensis]
MKMSNKKINLEFETFSISVFYKRQSSQVKVLFISLLLRAFTSNSAESSDRDDNSGLSISDWVGRRDDGLYVWPEKGHSSCSLIVVVVWRHIVQKGDTVIDATCGNGYDTLAMVKMVADETHSGHVRGLVELFAICHSKMEELVPKGVPMRLVAFNLGYLPDGDKALITRSETTLQALEAAKRMLAPGGLITIYSGLCGPSWRK